MANEDGNGKSRGCKGSRGGGEGRERRDGLTIAPGVEKKDEGEVDSESTTSAVGTTKSRRRKGTERGTEREKEARRRGHEGGKVKRAATEATGARARGGGGGREEEEMEEGGEERGQSGRPSLRNVN